MPVITGASERRGRARISVDGEPWAELDAGVAAERGLLSVGAEFSQRELDEAREAGERPLAMSRALNVLGYRPRSEKELEERLSRAGYAPGTVDAVVARLGELRYLDDEGFARDLARAKANKSYGPRRILGDLRKAGVDEEVARRAVDEEFSDSSDEREEALAAAQRRYNTFDGPNAGGGSDAQTRDAVARRVYGFLTRRGYSAGICAEIARLYRQGEL